MGALAPAKGSPLGVAARREKDIEKLSSQRFDLLVVGGGIVGAGTAREAALRGLKVALLEQGDFAQGTSSRSSKMVHGGLRYLEQYQFGLVAEACAERRALQRIAPHVVRPRSFVIPAYRGRKPGRAKVELGMWVYDAVAAFRNTRVHRPLSAKRLRAMEPALRSEKLAGGGLFFDCITDDARLTLFNLLDAQRLGATILNHARCVGFEWEEGPKAVALVEEQLVGKEFEVSAKVVVNASGPWSDHVSKLADKAAPKRLRLTKGAHIVVPRERLGNIRALVLRAPQDNRVFFVVPWDSLSLIGTTDTDFTGEPAEARADSADVDYLLTAANHYFPNAALTRKDVVSAYAGLRPLLHSESGGPSDVSREHALFVGPPHFISVVGGKLTTFRRMAHEVVEEAAGHGGLQLSEGSTRKRALPGGESPSANADAAAQQIAKEYGISPEESELLYWLHGSMAGEVLQAGGPRAKKRIHPELGYLNASIVWSFAQEHACSLEDAMVRRVPLALRLHDRGASIARAVADEVAAAAGWNPTEAKAQADAYVAAAKAAYPWRGD